MLQHFLSVADAEAKIELVGAFLGKQDGENLVVDQALDELRGFRQNLVEVQRRIDFLADFDQRRKSFGGNLAGGFGLDWIHG